MAMSVIFHMNMQSPDVDNFFLRPPLAPPHLSLQAAKRDFADLVQESYPIFPVVQQAQPYAGGDVHADAPRAKSYR